MTRIFHDFIIIEPEESKGVLKQHNDSINSGIVKGIGLGYTTEIGEFIPVEGIYVGDKILFTQFLALDVDGQKIYVVRYRDVIKGESVESQASV